MKKIITYKDLEVWQLSMSLVERMYLFSSSFPQAEKFGLTSQLRRSCVSIPANISEGKGRLNLGEYKQFLNIARGSAFEVATLLEIASRFGYGDDLEGKYLYDLTDKISAMLYKLIRSLS